MPRGKQPNGLGSVRHRTREVNGKVYHSIEGRITVGFDSQTGRQVQKTVSGKTEKEVIAKLRKLQNDSRLSQVKYNRLTVADWLNIYIEDYTLNLAPKTKNGYQAFYDRFIIPSIGRKQLEKLTTHDVQSLIKSLNDRVVPKPLSPKTIREIFGAFRVAMNQAAKQHLIPYNPCEGCILPKIRKKNMDSRVLMDEGRDRFLEAIKGHKHENAFLTALYTGLRESELCALRRDNIDFKRKTLTVEQQLVYCKDDNSAGRYELKALKTDNSLRVLKLTDAAIDVLTAQCQLVDDMEAKAKGQWHNEEGYIFVKKDGSPVGANALYQAVKKVYAKIGLPDRNFHSLRHSFVVLSLEAGVGLAEISEMLGHYDTGFSFKQYGHISKRIRDTNADKLDAYIQAINKGQTRGKAG